MTAIDTRNLKRDSLLMMADVRIEGRIDSVRMKVRNLSNSGIMLEGPLVATSGQRVIVSVKKLGDIGGVVAWTQSAKIGISFDEPINASVARVSLVGDMPEAPRYARPAVRPPEPVGTVRKL